MTTSARDGIRRLGDFSGRDSRAVFWSYAGVVIGVVLVSGNALLVPVIAASLVFAPPTALWLVVPMLLGTSLIVLVNVVLLAAAVTRRLHDRGRRGTWAVLPLAALLAALAMMIPLSRAAERGDDPGIMFVAMAISLLYFLLLAVLVVQLILPGDPHENRFGQP